MSVDNVRRRTHDNNNKNGVTKSGEDDVEKEDPDFKARESPLTLLFESSLHIRALYHIFIAILIILLLDTVTYDLVEKGKINVGIRVIIHGFGDIVRGFKLWVFEVSVAIAFYPCLRLYAAGAKVLEDSPGLRGAWSVLGIMGMVALQTTLFAVPIWCLAREHLALASGVTVTLEMLRLAMKMHAACVACAPRCRRGGVPLPSFRHYMYFLFAPTLLYRDHYPRTRRIRWGVVVKHFAEVAAIIFYNSFLWERFILPYWSDYGKEPKVEAGRVVRAMFACVLPGVISFLCGFYSLLHAWLNAFAEIMTFADRMFYEEWWTTSQYSKYYRAWNRVVYLWLRQHLHYPVSRYTNRTISMFCVFFVSALAHELVLALSFGFFYPVLMIEFGLIGMLCVPLTATSGRLYPNIVNLWMWFGFLFGNGLLWSLYPMEHFARKNCPPSASDSFFIPKSWSCPSVVLKPNWTFNNPIDLFD